MQQHHSAAGSKGCLQQTMSQVNLNLLASDRRKAAGKQEKGIIRKEKPFPAAEALQFPLPIVATQCFFEQQM